MVHVLVTQSTFIVYGTKLYIYTWSNYNLYVFDNVQRCFKMCYRGWRNVLLRGWLKVLEYLTLPLRRLKTC